jgi:ABC-type glycerol-3-phosphate transport system permease component
MHFKWADRVFTYILIGLIVPMQMTLVPLTLLMNALNLIDTLTGLTILYIGLLAGVIPTISAVLLLSNLIAGAMAFLTLPLP